jgi:SSS family solute:Na+ symporter
MSTADSCLMAASGNVVSDILGYFKDIDYNSDTFLRFSQVTTLLIGGAALLIAGTMTNVLKLMLYSYAFMVSGLFVPIVGALYWSKSSSIGAIGAMIIGGSTTILLEILPENLPAGLDANVFGITASAVTFIGLSLLFPDEQENPISENAIEEADSKIYS